MSDVDEVSPHVTGPADDIEEAATGSLVADSVDPIDPVVTELERTESETSGTLSTETDTPTTERVKTDRVKRRIRKNENANSKNAELERAAGETAEASKAAETGKAAETSKAAGDDVAPDDKSDGAGPELGGATVTELVEGAATESVEPEPADPVVTEDLPGEAVMDEVDAEDSGADDALGFDLPPAMSQMLFVDVVLVLPSTHPVVVLQEADFPYRELRIPIGGPEGIAIGYASRRVPTPRPLTHELISRLMESFGLTLDVVRITGLQGGMFTAEITVSGPNGQRNLDCRPSDGIALALRQQIRVPIMADPDVLDRAAGAAAGQN